LAKEDMSDELLPDETLFVHMADIHEFETETGLQLMASFMK